MTIDPNEVSSQSQQPQQAAGRIVAYGNPDKEGLPRVLQAIAQWTSQQQMELCLAREIVPALESVETAGDWHYQVYSEEEIPRFQRRPAERAMLVCLGGDGTLIRAIRRFWPMTMPVMAVNLGSLGFNASVEPERVTQALDAWFDGNAYLSERMAIQVRWQRGDEVLGESVAVNDVVLVKQSEARLIHFSVRQGNTLLSSFAADGLIVATPTGSTAYNLSAGGPIVYPTMQALIATAICPHTLASRPMVLPPTPALNLEFVMRHKRDQALLWVDGQERWPLLQGDRVAVEAAPVPLHLVSNGAAHYFATLRRKLCWSGKPVLSDAAADE